MGPAEEVSRGPRPGHGGEQEEEGEAGVLMVPEVVTQVTR